MADIFFYIASKELKIAQITQINQLFQLLNLVRIYGYGFYELDRMLMSKNVNTLLKNSSNTTFLYLYPSLLWLYL